MRPVLGPPIAPRDAARLVGSSALGRPVPMSEADAAELMVASNDDPVRYPVGTAPSMLVLSAAVASLEALAQTETVDDLWNEGVLLASHAVVLSRAPRLGETLVGTSTVRAALSHAFRAALDIETTVHDSGGLVVASMSTLVVAPRSGVGLPSRRAHRAVRGNPRAVRTIPVRVDAAERFASAVKDFNPIHLDERVAVTAGLRAPILHGMCVLALLAVAGSDVAGDDAVSAAAASFLRPVHPGDELDCRFFGSGSSITVDAAVGGRVVVRDSRVEIGAFS